MPHAPLVDIIPGVLAALWLLAAESRRLPAQNAVALPIVATLGGAALEGAFQYLFPTDASGQPWAARTLQWVVLLLGSRSLGRLFGSGHLFLQTLLAAACLAPALVLPRFSNALEITGRLVLIPVVLLFLAPWWIRKPLAPATAPRQAALAAPLLATWIQVPAQIDAAELSRIVVAWMPILWIGFRHFQRRTA